MLNIPKPRKALSELEHLVMDCIWSLGAPATAGEVRDALRSRRPLEDSTVRTVLRRLEDKGYLTHKVDGRTYIYSGVDPQNVAVRAVRQIIDLFCGGSVEQLIVGMVEHEVLDRRELERLARKVGGRKPKEEK